MMQIRHSFPFLVLNCIERACARNTTMAPTAQLHVLAQPRPFACKRRQIRNIAARAAVLEAPNAVPGELEAEAAEMKSMYSEFAELMQGTVMTFKPGDCIMGTVVDVTRKGAFVDIGGKGAAFVSTEELSVASVADASEILRAGMARRFTVLGTRYEVVQLSMAVQEKAIMWQRLRQMQEEDCTIPGTVLSSNRGGVMVSVMNTRGFVPNSHIGPVADKESLMGTDLQLKFLEVDESAGKLLLSARRVRSADSLANYRVGDVVEGVVTKVIHFGAFLELADGISGLLHISQVSHDRVMNMEKLINVGDRMKVMIMSHDRERERLALSTKKLEPTPGDMLKDPAIVFARAEEMASLFKVRVAAAEQAAKEDEQQQQQLQAAAESQPQAESVQATETW